MIKKIISIKNVGRFLDYSAEGNVEFQRLTLIYSENGRGKTTLCSILRSLCTGENKYILCRTTLAGNGNPEVTLRLESNNAVFKNDKWDIPLTNIEIFDPVFISSNVYSGDYVEPDNKKGLYRFAVGEEGVKLATKIDRLDHEIREKTKEIGEREKEIKKFMVQDIPLKDFISLPAIADIEMAISAKENEIGALRKAAEIAAKAPLSKINLPVISFAEIKDTLLKTVETISSEAVKMVKDHIANCMDENGESWIRQGVSYIRNEVCPFCNQSLSGLALIDAYGGFFSEAYNSLKQEIEEHAEKVQDSFSKNEVLAIHETIQTNKALADFWRQHVTTSYPELESRAVGKVLDDISESLIACLNKKSAHPLEEVKIDDELQANIDAYLELVKNVSVYNKAVDEVNTLINAKKQATVKENVITAESALAKLKNTRARHLAEVVKACNEYEELVASKKKFEDEKVEARKNLDPYDKKIIEQYEKDINLYLENFGAGFKIVDSKTSYMGGKPSSTYRILINDTPVELGDSKTEDRSPSFKNTLSSGDKSTLAFAFFLAKMDRDSDLTKKIVVFDDPISSLDGHRKFCTREQVLKISEKAKQAIVLSHDPNFLFDVHNHASVSIGAIQIKRSGRDSIITEWDPEKETRSDYIRSYYALTEYLESGPAGELREVARSIRPILEGNMRLRYPREFKSSKMLGDMLEKIRAATSGENLFSLYPMLSELEEINNYSKRYHHENPQADKEPISDGALQSYVKRALKVIHGA